MTKKANGTKPRRRRISEGELLPPERRGITTPSTSVPAVLSKQHVVHGVFGTVFEQIGGEERLADWANENYDKFLQMFVKMAPAPREAPVDKKVQIQINNELAPSPLDE